MLPGILRRTHYIEGMAPILACKCIMTIFRTASILTLWWLKKRNKIGVSGILKPTHGMKFNESSVCQDHLQNWWDFGHGVMISYFWRIFYQMIKFGGSRNFLENAWKGWPNVSRMLKTVWLPSRWWKEWVTFEVYFNAVGIFPGVY